MSKNSSRGVDRRLFLAGSVAAAGFAPALANAAIGDLVYYVGSYASEGGAGVSTLSYSAAYDKWTQGKKPDPTVPNASYGVYSPKLKRHYVVNEQENGLIGIYQVSANGSKWTKKGEVSSQGSGPCYISLDATESYLAVANYNSGNIAVYKLDEKTGLPIEPAIVKQNSGSGPNAERQQGPHAHWVKFSPDQKYIYSVDLGTDEVLGYSFDATSGAVGEKFVAYKCEPGFGPRHLNLHPSGQVAHILGELENALITLRPKGDGTFEDVQYIKTLPADFTGASFAGHMAMNDLGNILYVSNRGHNSIAVFGLDTTGRLALLQIIPTGGDWPRFFYIVPGFDRLVVAHQKSNDVTVMAQYTNGTLRKHDAKFTVNAPVFMAPVA